MDDKRRVPASGLKFCGHTFWLLQETEDISATTKTKTIDINNLVRVFIKNFFSQIKGPISM